MPTVEKKRRSLTVIIICFAVSVGTAYKQIDTPSIQPTATDPTVQTQLAGDALKRLAVKGRAPRTGYSRAHFGGGWEHANGCDMRNHILKRDMIAVAVRSAGDCTVLSGTVRSDPYTGKTIHFSRGPGTSQKVQIDHVVAVADAWQKGAQQLTGIQRQAFYNDPLNLLAVDGPANGKKGDGDAATWLPPNKPYRCRYVARQIAVKIRYSLWVTHAEQKAMQRVLRTCPDQVLPVVASP
jgi:hypothetical protein